MDRERVHYLSHDDLLYANNLDKIEAMQIPDLQEITINDAIEYYVIKKYFDVGTRSKSWSDAEFETYRNKSSELYKICMAFFKQKVTDETFVGVYQSIDIGYHVEFWDLFNHYKLYNSISHEKFKEITEEKFFAPVDVFSYKRIVKVYGSVLREYVLNDKSAISLILRISEQGYTREKTLYLPDELTGEDICNYIDTYIDSDNPNANYLEYIAQMQHTKRFPISNRTRLKAKRKLKIVLDKLSETSASIYHGIGVSFSNEQKEPKNCVIEKNECNFSYSIPWLLDTLDYPSLLNNFIYLFEYVDLPQMRCNLVSKESYMGVFEKIFKPKSIRNYSNGASFLYLNNIALMQMNGYYEFLKRQNIRLEDVLKWFYTEYLQTEFLCPEMRVSFPSENTTYAEKCYTIITAFEAILKQFDLYVTDGNIDFELIGMSSSSVKFSEISSLVKDKYLYGHGDDFKRATNILFSDQCILTYVLRITKDGKDYNCFYELICNENVYLSDYREFNRPLIKFLEEKHLIIVNCDGLISVGDKSKIKVLKDLYENEVANKKHYPKSFYPVVQELIDDGMILEKSSLLSDPEVNYFNYLLNHAEYTNGLDIRNKYIHGIQQVNLNESEHKKNYMWLLIVFIILTIKINDDFCLSEITD